MTRVWGVGVPGMLLALLISASPEAAGRLVTFRAADGRMLSGLLMEARDRPASAVVLAPMLGRPKDDWQVVAQRLADANINALAVDLTATIFPAATSKISQWNVSA